VVVVPPLVVVPRVTLRIRFVVGGRGAGSGAHVPGTNDGAGGAVLKGVHDFAFGPVLIVCGSRVRSAGGYTPYRALCASSLSDLVRLLEQEARRPISRIMLPRHQQANQDADDGDHHQPFHQGKTARPPRAARDVSRMA